MVQQWTEPTKPYILNDCQATLATVEALAYMATPRVPVVAGSGAPLLGCCHVLCKEYAT